MRLLFRLGVLCSLLALPVYAQMDDEIDQALQGLPPQQRALYHDHLTRLDRVSRRVLQAVPNPPQVNILYAAGEQSVNAGATVGKIIVTEGMMRFVRSDDELAMILGHEMAHLTQGHVTRGEVSNSLLGIGSAIVGAIFPGGDLATNLVGQLVINHFNQDQERAADRVGLGYVYAAGYDPQAAAYVMQRMAEEVPETASSGFFSSHPSSTERFATLQQIAAQLKRGSDSPHRPAEVAEYQRQQARDEDTCRTARTYFYRAHDTAEPQEQVRLYQRGLRLCPESARAHAELADVYVRLGETRKAASQLRETLRYNLEYPGARRKLRALEQRLARGTR